MGHKCVPLTFTGAYAMSDWYLHIKVNLRRGLYIYSDDIQALERCVPVKAPSMSLLETIVSPLSDALEA